LIVNGVRIVDPFFTIKSGWMDFSDKILSVGTFDGNTVPSDLILMPGFVDTHVHGGAGYDFMDEDIDFDKIEAHFFSMGVTSVLATTLTAPIDKIKRVTKKIKQRIEENEYTPFVGVHLEGPIISPKYLGAQNPKYVVIGAKENVQRLIDGYEDTIKVMTVAIEQCEDSAIRYIMSRGIRVSVGHSDASFEDFKEVHEFGVNHLTHFCNAMAPLHHRHIGLVGAGLFFDDVDLEIIPDGIHLDKDMLSLILKAHPIEHIIAITDGMRATGLDDGIYDLGGLKVRVENDSARLSDGTLAGSILEYNEGLKRLHNLGLSLNEIAMVSSFNPSNVAKPSTPKGRILPGYDADFVLMDENFSIRKVIKKGKIVYSI
jgi:N-acetylglucosamine-6-phosphate deacetylase